jgi:hypothetical protein
MLRVRVNSCLCSCQMKGVCAPVDGVSLVVVVIVVVVPPALLILAVSTPAQQQQQGLHAHNMVSTSGCTLLPQRWPADYGYYKKTARGLACELLYP